MDRDRCIECGACMMNCSFGAIRVNSGVGCAAALINGLIRGGEPQCGCGGNEERGESCC
jgi:Fe-S-cluster-containing hydrogenase component 2